MAKKRKAVVAAAAAVAADVPAITELNDAAWAEAWAGFRAELGHGTAPSEVKHRYIDFVDLANGRPCLPLEYLTGCRGLPAGRLVQLLAPEGGGKSALMLMFIGMLQRRNKRSFSMVYETEGTIPPADFVAMCGADRKLVLFAHPSRLEEFTAMTLRDTELANKLDPQQQMPRLLVLDSMSGLGVKEAAQIALDIKNGVPKATVAEHSRHMGEYFREAYRAKIAPTNTVMIIISQLRNVIAKEGFKGGSSSPLDTSDGTDCIAGVPLRYHSTFRIMMEHKRHFVKDAGYDGENITMRMIKNKMNFPNRKVTVLQHGEGYAHSYENTIFDWKQATLDLLFQKDTSPWPDEVAVASKWRNHKRLQKGRNFTSDDFLEAFFADEALLMEARAHWRVRGFGLPFEQDLVEEEEAEDVADADAADDSAAPAPAAGMPSL